MTLVSTVTLPSTDVINATHKERETERGKVRRYELMSETTRGGDREEAVGVGWRDARKEGGETEKQLEKS